MKFTTKKEAKLSQPIGFWRESRPQDRATRLNAPSSAWDREYLVSCSRRGDFIVFAPNPQATIRVLDAHEDDGSMYERVVVKGPLS